MFENRDFFRRFGGSPLTLALVASLVAAYLAQWLVVPEAFAERYLWLSLEGLQRGYFWQLLSYQFMHGGWLHLLVNCWAVFVFGREVELALGKARTLALYFASGTAGGLLQMAFAWLWPSHFGGAVVGASAGAFGLAAAFATIDPERELMVLLFFVIPLRMRAKTLLLACVGLAVLGIAFPGSFLGTFFGARIAEAAHLGGIVTGFLGALWIVGLPRRRGLEIPV